jgi:hypothetical protein
MSNKGLSADDRFAIQDLLFRYATCIDTRNWNLLRTCFAAQCDVDYGIFGAWRSADELAERMEVLHRDVGPSWHRLSNIAPVADGEAALCKTYVDVIILPKPGERRLHGVGWYEDRLVRQDGGWVFKVRRYTGVRI